MSRKLSSGLVLVCAGCSPLPAKVAIHGAVPISLVGQAPRTEPQAAHWEAFAAAPDAQSIRVTIRRGKKELNVDAGYARWLRDGSQPMKRSAATQEGALQAVAWLDLGVVAATASGKLLVAEDPVGPWRTLLDGEVPTRLLRTYQQALTIEQGGKVGIVPRIPKPGAPFDVHWLEEFEGRVVLDARLDAEGKGLVMFSPQRLAETSDFGHSYRPISDDGVLAKELKVDGSRVVIVPGGQHDVFARSYAPGSGKLERSLNVPDETQAYVAVGEAPQWGPSGVDSDSRRVSARFSMAAASPVATRYAVDGDTVLYLGARRLLEFALGEPIIDSPWENTLGRADRGVACKGTFAVVFKDQVYVRQGQQTWRQLDLMLPTPRSAYGPRVQGLTLVSPRYLVISADKKAFVVDLESPKPSQRFVAFDLKNEELESACGDELPAEVWTSYQHHRTGSFAVDLNAKEAIKATPLPSNPSGRTDTWIANLDDGTQLFWTPRGLVRLDTKGIVENLPLPGADPVGRPSLDGGSNQRISGLAFNREGQGIYIEPKTGNVWQTIDAGRTFTKTRGLGRALDGKKVFCTRTRCEVENQAIRVGWDDPKRPDSHEDQRQTRDVSQGIQCSDVQPLTLPKGLAATDVDEPVQRLDAADWVAAVIQAKEREIPDEGMSAIGPNTDNAFGFITERANSLEYYPQRKWRGPIAAAGVRVYASRSMAGVIAVPGGMAGISGQLPVEAWSIPEQPHQAPRKTTLSPGEFGYATPGFSLLPGALVWRDGVAFVDANERRLFLLDRHGKGSRRTWAGSTDFDDPYPSIEQTSDGKLWSVRGTGSELEVLAIDPDGYVHEARRALAPAREVGAGFVNDGGRPSVVLAVDRGRGRQLWQFPIDDQLQIGVGTPIGTTKLNADGLLDFPVCTGAPKNVSYSDLVAADMTANVAGATWQGQLRRTLRIESAPGASGPTKTVCIANTQFKANQVNSSNDMVQTAAKILWRSSDGQALVWVRGTGAANAHCTFTKQ